MEPIKRGKLEDHIYVAVVEFSDNRKQEKLQTKPNSVCHFFEPFCVENDIINLRIDWSDIRRYGNPTLDADFYDKNTNTKHPLKGERKDAHHTLPIGEGQLSYCWEFKDYKKPFKVSVGWLLSANVKVGVHCSASLEVKRATED